MLKFILGTIFGGSIGYILFGVFNMSGKCSRDEEKRWKEMNGNEEKL